ncbi:MAG TPA: N-6 DNA methylase [Kiritimatiellia bacterium]|nr:N-6 DNA methylase [Kiritimatiellia bacterium]
MDEQGALEVDKMLREFIIHKPQTIRRPKELAKRMANLAHMVRDIIVKALEQNEASDTLKDWRTAFAQTLMHDLMQPERTGDFADMFAQTIAYGLFSARVMDPTPEDFSRQEAQALIPKSNPFLRNFFYQITGPDLDKEPFAPFVEDLVSVLGHTDMNRVLEDFGVSKKTRDPVFHFYETFLAEYDPKLREQRGVYYTPDPVVSYIVRSVDHILKTKFKCADGLADKSKVLVDNWKPENRTKKATQKKKVECHRVLILDPACGTGTFLYDIIGLIRNQFMERNDAGMWPGYVKKSLLPRLFGFELMMAPYAIAHFKLSLQLAGRDLLELQAPGWKYEMEDDDRLGIFLTNTLEDMHEMSGLPLFARWIAEETEAANEVKRDLPIMVICGNPPYSGHSENKGAWISDKIEDYKFVNGQPLNERNSKWLQDDYVKFIRFAQWRLDQSGSGVLAFISNNGYLDNPTFRGMRWSLMQSFNDIYILNLHGNSRTTDIFGEAEEDENVFDIQTGVCIGIFVKQPGSSRKCQVHYASMTGERTDKYSKLSAGDLSKMKWSKVGAVAPSYFFIPQNEGLRDEYNAGVLLTDIFLKQSMGVATARDELTVAWSKNELLERIQEFAQLSEEDARKQFRLGKDARDWKVAFAQQDVLQTECSEKLVSSYAYRPFDSRFTYYTGKTKGFLCMPRSEVMQNLNGTNNKALCFVRRSRENVLSNYFVVTGVVDKTLLSSADNANVAPLYLYPNSAELNFGEATRKPNLSEQFIAEFSNKLGLKFVADGQGDLKKTVGPEDVFYYIYAVLHSPTYRTRYADFLKIDFPRVPLTSDKKLFAALVKLGGELTALHLMESPELNKPATSFPVAGDNIVAKGFPKFKDGRVYINKTQYFDNVPSNVWNFTIGGYQVCEKWLKDRRERVLTNDDLQHYKKIVAALGRTIELMREIDQAIPKWPME